MLTIKCIIIIIIVVVVICCYPHVLEFFIQTPNNKQNVLFLYILSVNNYSLLLFARYIRLEGFHVFIQ